MKKRIIVILLILCGSLVIYSYFHEKPLIKDQSRSRIVTVMLGEKDITSNLAETQKQSILGILKQYHRSPSISRYGNYKVTTETIEVSFVDQDEETWHLVMGDVTFCYTDNVSQYKIKDSTKLLNELKGAILSN